MPKIQVISSIKRTFEQRKYHLIPELRRLTELEGIQKSEERGTDQRSAVDLLFLQVIISSTVKIKIQSIGRDKER